MALRASALDLTNGGLKIWAAKRDQKKALEVDAINQAYKDQTERAGKGDFSWVADLGGQYNRSNGKGGYMDNGGTVSFASTPSGQVMSHANKRVSLTIASRSTGRPLSTWHSTTGIWRWRA